MKEQLEAFETLGAQVMAISFAKPKLVANYIAKYEFPFPALSDADRNLYRALSLDKTTWLGFFHPGVIWRYVRLMFRGWALQKANEGEDLLQLGGDFVLDGERKLRYAYRSAEPTDRPPVSELLEALRTPKA